MKSAFRCKSEVFIDNLALRQLQDDEIRLKVDACGICGTDIFANESQKAEQFGHEIAGTIMELNTSDPRLQVGQQVVLDSATPCGRCNSCRNAKQELCSDLQSIWCIPSFGFSEEMLAPAISAIPYHDLSPEVATLQEPLGVAIDLVRLAEITPDSNVLIMGAGPIGLMALALAKHHGVKNVFVSDFKNKTGRMQVAQQFGAAAFIDPNETLLNDYDFKCDIDRVLVTSPPPTLNSAFKVATKGAIISFIGIGHGDAAFCKFDVNDFHFKKLQLRASFASPALFGAQALQYLNQGIVDGEALISHRFPLENIAKALETAKNDPTAVKVVIIP
ncbi:MAG: alcohol dehydrogenase catalytic domain-containing protein [Victivallaceae bacterium]|nr:alcohol dehydrogenase catalytic domain-containing protein [Victivallaceae bacterium]